MPNKAKIVLIVLFALAGALITILPTLAAPAYSYNFQPNSSYQLTSDKAALIIYPGAGTTNPTRVDWLNPAGTKVSHCSTGSCGASYDQSLSSNGLLNWRRFYFYISGQSRSTGTYTAVVYERRLISGIYVELELFRANFTISGTAATPSPTPPPTPTPVPGGVLDISYGIGGQITGDLEEFSSMPLVLQPDGKLLAGGKDPVSLEYSISRYTNNGDLDLDFGTGGRKVLPMEDAQVIRLQPDGKLLAGGSKQDTSSVGWGLTRLNPDGSLDSDFGTSGLVTTAFGGTYAQISDLLVQPDHKILAVGSTYDQVTSEGAYALARYMEGGSLDPDFGTAGIQVTRLAGGFFESALSVLLVGDKILVAGTGIDGKSALVRYTAGGILDTSFDGDGILELADNFGFFSKVALLWQGNKILWGGTVNGDFAISRFNQDGSLDSDFGVGGLATTDFSAGDDAANQVLLLPNGKILAAGYTREKDGSWYDFAIARYTPDGILDNAHDGAKIISDLLFNDRAYNAVGQWDGKVILGGLCSDKVCVARYTVGDSVALYIPLVKSP